MNDKLTLIHNNAAEVSELLKLMAHKDRMEFYAYYLKVKWVFLNYVNIPN